MKNKTLTLTLSLLLITTISAIDIFAGESKTITLEKEFEYYSIVGNSTEVILNITQNGNNVTITPHKYSVTDTYSVIFFDKEKETITVYIGGGSSGGGSRTIYKDREITKYVDMGFANEVEVIKEVEVPVDVTPVEEKDNRKFILAGFLFFLLACWIVYFFTSKNKNKYIYPEEHTVSANSDGCKYEWGKEE